MTYGASIVTLLGADGTLTAILTGGIYQFETPGRKGINRVQLPDAFDEKTGLLKPMCIIYEAQEIATNEAVDAASGYMSTTTPIMGWIYDQGNAGYANVDAAYNRIYSLLAFKQIPNAFQIFWVNTIKNKRESLLSDACYYSFNCRVYGFRTS